MNRVSGLWDRVDNLLRHESALGRHAWLRNVLRKPYHRILSFNSRGYGLQLGGCLDVRVPPEFRSKLMESYEVEEFREIKRWCDRVSDGWFVDVGSSVGFMSCAALTANSTVRVLAIDTDLNSLKSVRRLCKYSGLERLTCMQALIAETSTTSLSFNDLVQQTVSRLNDAHITGDPGTHQYINVGDPRSELAPQCSLDDLLRPHLREGEPLLIKCDIEGAEFVALQGMQNLLQTMRPPLLLSVHPKKLAAFGYSVEQVAALLAKYHYTVVEIAVDHECHWLCEAT